ncbi:hypothetical protein PGQ11_005749 [Apiospora arundinis]|uniref:Uncharacterized protein n=1 Tax=Apiospora arundinis TaxID=335852 RepID=A0ABR2JC10_9PEZI
MTRWPPLDWVTNFACLECCAAGVSHIPEIFSIIVNIYQDIRPILDKTPFSIAGHEVWLDAKQTALGPLARVNYLWFHQVVPVLWREPCQTDGDTFWPDLLRGINALERCNLYAQYIEWGSVLLVGDWKPDGFDDSDSSSVITEQVNPVARVSDVDFPRLRSMFVMLGHGAYIPQVRKQRGEHLFISPDPSRTFTVPEGSISKHVNMVINQSKIWNTGPRFEWNFNGRDVETEQDEWLLCERTELWRRSWKLVKQAR